MAKTKNGGLKNAKLADQQILRGAGGETHQVAGGDVQCKGLRRAWVL
jgi:hypothetical protein